MFNILFSDILFRILLRLLRSLSSLNLFLRRTITKPTLRTIVQFIFRPICSFCKLAFSSITKPALASAFIPILAFIFESWKLLLFGFYILLQLWPCVPGDIGARIFFLLGDRGDWNLTGLAGNGFWMISIVVFVLLLEVVSDQRWLSRLCSHCVFEGFFIICLFRFLCGHKLPGSTIFVGRLLLQLLLGRLW